MSKFRNENNKLFLYMYNMQSSKPNSKKSKDPVLKKEFNKSFKVKKIETCTVYGKKKNGMIDQAQYKGTFIKGTPDDFNLLGFYNNFFNRNEK